MKDSKDMRIVVDTDTKSMYTSWYPTLEMSLTCLSKIYHSVEVLLTCLDVLNVRLFLLSSLLARILFLKKLLKICYVLV